MVLSFETHENFKKSMSEIKKFYNVGIVKLRDSSPLQRLTKFGNVFILTKLIYKADSQSLLINIPEKLYMIENFKKYTR